MVQTSQEARLQEVIRKELPVARFMAVRVASWNDSGLTLRSPEAPNRNAHGTTFGGSISALGLLAGWGLINLRLAEVGIDAEVVVQRSCVDYRSPLLGEVEAIALMPSDDDWSRFLRTYERRGRARLRLIVEISGETGEAPGGVMEGVFVAMAREEASSPEAEG